MDLSSGPGNSQPDRDYQIVVSPEPEYPSGSATEGFIDIETDISPTGTVSNPVIVFRTSILPKHFDAAALDAVRKFRYKPRIENGVAVTAEGVRERILFRHGARYSPNNSMATETSSTRVVGEFVYNEIQAAQKLVESKNYESAQKRLQRLLDTADMNEFERANVLNYLGFVHYNQKQNVMAVGAYARLLRIPTLDFSMKKTATYTLAQLQTIEENYESALGFLDIWLLMEVNPEPAAYILKGQILYNLARHEDMADAIETALFLAAKNNKPVKEDWYNLLNYAYFKQGKYAKVAEIKQVLNRKWPSELHFISLAGAHVELRDYPSALTALIEANRRWPSEKSIRGIAATYLKLEDHENALATYGELLADTPETDMLSPIHLAAAGGDVDTLAQLVASGVSVDLTNDDATTPLHWAALFGTTESAKVLIDWKANVDAKDDKGWSALHRASNNGDVLFADLLINAGADINASSKDTLTTPLMMATKAGDVPMATLLIRSGADVNAKNAQGVTALHIAAEASATMVEILIAAGAELNAQTRTGRSPLHVAARNGNPSTLQLLVEAGSDIDATDAQAKTVWHHGIRKLAVPSLVKLAESSSTFDVISTEGYTPLHIAAREGNEVTVEWLIAAGSDVNGKGKDSVTPLHLAAVLGKQSVVATLVSAGADVNAGMENNITPLHLAAQSGNLASARTLLSAGANIETKTSNTDRTSLAYAALNPNVSMGLLLVEQGADISAIEDTIELVPTANARYLLAWLYEHGIGVRQKNSRAIRWYKSAAELGHPGAKYALVKLHLAGRRVKTESKQMAQWIQSSAHQGHRDAMAKLGTMYSKGGGVARDSEAAAMWSCLAGVGR